MQINPLAFQGFGALPRMGPAAAEPVGRPPPLRYSPLRSPGAGADALRFEIVGDEAGLLALAPAWQTIVEGMARAQLHQRFDWQWQVWHTIARAMGRRLRVIVGRRDGEPVLIWPLVGNGDHLSFLSCEQTEYRDIIIADDAPDAWLDAAWQVAAAMPRANCLILPDVREDARLAGLLHRHGGRSYRVQRRTWLIDLAAFMDFDAYWASRPKRLVADQRRQWRRAGEMPGGVRFEVARTPAEAESWLNWFFAMKLVWLANRGISTRSFGSPEYRSFVRATTLDAMARDGLLVGRLVTGRGGGAADIVSAGFGYVAGPRFVFQSFAFNPAYQAISPSRLLLEHLVRWCFARGLTTFDFLPGDTAYKEQWATGTLDIFDHLVPLSLLGRAKLAWHTLALGRMARHPGIRGLYRRLPDGLRGRMRSAMAANLDYGSTILPPD